MCYPAVLVTGLTREGTTEQEEPSPLSHLVLVSSLAGLVRREGTVGAGQLERASRSRWGCRIRQTGDFIGLRPSKGLMEAAIGQVASHWSLLWK